MVLRGYDMRLYALPKMRQDCHQRAWSVVDTFLKTTMTIFSRLHADARGSFMGQVDDSGPGIVAG